MKIDVNKTIALIGLLVFSACDSYLDVEPKGLVIPETIEDYDFLMNGNNFSVHTTADETVLFIPADDYVIPDQTLAANPNPNDRSILLYTWRGDLFLNENRNVAWDKSYENIYTYNKIINEVENATIVNGYDQGDRAVIRAEALVGRAYEYWLLVNTFGKQYNAASASSDLGVPIVTQADVSQETPARSTIEELYAFILNDVSEAIPDLPDFSKSTIRFSKGAAYGFLARYYLFMGNYEKARENAINALEEKSYLADYNNPNEVQTASEAESYVQRFYQYFAGYVSGFLSDEMQNLFESDDARFTNQFRQYAYFDYEQGRPIFTDNFLPLYLEVSHAVGVPEMYLIRAECNARLENGVSSEVIDDLNTLREKRFPMYQPLSETDFADKSELFSFVLEERRREMVRTGIRYFDLKRLNLEPEFQKTLTHTVDGVDYTLAPNANNYVFPIPQNVLNFNPSMPQNPRD